MKQPRTSEAERNGCSKPVICGKRSLSAQHPSRKSARGLAQSKSWRWVYGFGFARSVLECGSPLPLLEMRATCSDTWRAGLKHYINSPLCTALLICGFTTGCRDAPPSAALVLTQTPLEAKAASQSQNLLDERYPAGSRVVLAVPPYQPSDVRVLSQGLLAAGGPIVDPNGQRIFFMGKANEASAWQIYQANLKGGRPKRVTSLEGGAMHPAIIANGNLVFSSPVPNLGHTWDAQKPAALYVQSSRGQPERLTFGRRAAVEPTVLRDGRILFVSAHPSPNSNAPPNLGLFTVNSDGTEVTPFALDRDGAPLVYRPRELPDKRIAFLATGSETGAREIWAETVRTARPFLSRERLFSFPTSACLSVEPDEEGAILVCLQKRNPKGTTPPTEVKTEQGGGGSSAVYRLASGAEAVAAPLFDDPLWHDIEATRAVARVKPMGYISATVPGKKTGAILCLNANFTRRKANESQAVKAERVRVVTGVDTNLVRVLGEVPLQSDGSFMAEVPADIPLGFEALDSQGRVIDRLPPTIWVRPGENRSCLGCHEPSNRSPRNLRPIAAGLPPVSLTQEPADIAQTTR